jgi:hypothetical protein
MNPNTTIIGLGSSQVQLSQQYYNSDVVLTNYTRAVAQMLRVIQTGKTIDQSPIPAGENSTLYKKAERIVALEKKISQYIATPDQSNTVEVSSLF